MLQFIVVEYAEKACECRCCDKAGEIIKVLARKIEAVKFEAANAPRAKSRAARACLHLILFLRIP